MGFATTGFLTALTVFLGCFLGAFFTCFFFPAMVGMPPRWILRFKLMMDGRFRVCGITIWRRESASPSDFSCDPLRVEQTLS